MQEGARKDVERAFGVLQARWEILRNTCRQWEIEAMTDIIQTCVIMHNMIIQDKSGLDLEPFFDEGLRGGRMGGGLSFHEVRVEDCHSTRSGKGLGK